jgi:hypothetical protein
LTFINKMAGALFHRCWLILRFTFKWMKLLIGSSLPKVKARLTVPFGTR